ncbi:SET domain-containing protein [Gigaspora margarita]|uniref:SET domain-containing protein n=1 Tax=Gigaspora margarita TaxID=4874 RepID=A0A8H3XC28_GIGMA|nr:SET domain-containing protein [Gigaspora margarita]
MENIIPSTKFNQYPVIVTYSPMKGRYFVAKRDIALGEVVLKCLPLSTAPFDNHRKRYCHTCKIYNSSSNSFKFYCKSCDLCYFCDRECFNQCFPIEQKIYDEKVIYNKSLFLKHELTCNISRKFSTWNINDKHMKSVVRLLVQILAERLIEKSDSKEKVNIEKESSINDLYNENSLELNEQTSSKNSDFLVALNNNFQDFLLLQSHLLDWPNDIKRDWLKHEKFLMNLFKSSKLLDEDDKFDDLLHMISKIESNGFGVYYKCKGKNVLFGRAIYPYASFFNHSCDANCDAIQDNYDKDELLLSTLVDDELLCNGKKLHGEMMFVALRNILKGEELTISYIQDENGLLPLQSRRQKLLSEYYFLCQCCKCITDEKQYRKKKKNVKNRNVKLNT